MVAKQNRNTIQSLTNLDGVKLISFSTIANEAISFFQGLLGKKDENVTRCLILLELLHNTLPREADFVLCRPITADEIRMTMFGIRERKLQGQMAIRHSFSKKLGTL